MSDLRVVAFMTNMFLLTFGKDIMKIPDQKINIRCVFDLLEIQALNSKDILKVDICHVHEYNKFESVNGTRR